jgi:hypothetical protein
MLSVSRDAQPSSAGAHFALPVAWFHSAVML